MILTIQSTDILPESSKATHEERQDERNLQPESTEKTDGKTMISSNHTTDILPESPSATQGESPEDRNFRAEPTENSK